VIFHDFVRRRWSTISCGKKEATLVGHGPSLYYIRFFFAYTNSDRNGEGCQAVGLSGGVQATIPTSCWPTTRQNRPFPAPRVRNVSATKPGTFA